MQSDNAKSWAVGSTSATNNLSGYGLMAATAMMAGLSISAPATQISQPQQQFAQSPTTTTAEYCSFRYSLNGISSTSLQLLGSAEMNPKVQSFMMMRPAADLLAIQQIYQLAIQKFSTTSGRPNLNFDIESDADSGPTLYVSLDTHGMDLEEQLNREINLRKAISVDERLSSAKQYLVINVY